MFERLPSPVDRPVVPAPVQLATVQVDFAEERPLVPKDGILWREGLRAKGYDTGRLVEVKLRTINVQVGNRAARSNVLNERDGWQVFFGDDSMNASVYSTGVNIECSGYPGYAKFRQTILDAYDVASDLLSPQVQQSVQLRYSNALSERDATTFDYWRGKVRAEFLGPTARPELCDALERVVMFVSWKAADESAEMQVGLQPDAVFDGCKAVVFQINAERYTVGAIDRQNLTLAVDGLHVVVLKLFESVLEPTYLESLRSAAVSATHA